ncbi:MAG: hypothetical protein KKI08_14685 [Armatimonadetes bacterium]|nr:hypothetical protein [Armatimonadota bacterium]
METPATKLLLIVCDQSVEPDVMDTLREHGLNHYTRWTDCQGSGETGRREGTPVWPGLNTVVMVVLPAEAIEPLRADLHAMRETFAIMPGLKMIVTDAVMM